MTIEFLPWQSETARYWLQRSEALAHAWLIHGQSGLGKRQMGLALAASLLCDTPIDLMACGQCQSCLWVKLDNHPDFMRVRPESLSLSEALHQDRESAQESPSSRSSKPSEIIKIDQVRALEPWYHRTTHRAGWRVVLLYPADSMTAESSNALLKGLEEPPPKTMFLLIADTVEGLLPTVVSRCQRLNAPSPTPNQARGWLDAQGVANAGQWLDMAGGAPLKALALSEQSDAPCPEWLQRLIGDLAADRLVAVTGIAEELAKLPTAQWLDELQRACIDLCLCAAQQTPRYLTGMTEPLRRIAVKQPLQSWVRLQVAITKRMSLAQHPLNTKLFAQDCLQQFTDTLL